jgi:hypothetical protein
MGSDNGCTQAPLPVPGTRQRRQWLPLHQKLEWRQGQGLRHATFLDVAAALERQSPEALNRLPGFTAGTSPGRFSAVKERMVLAAWKQEIASGKAAEEDLNRLLISNYPTKVSVFIPLVNLRT